MASMWYTDITGRKTDCMWCDEEIPMNIDIIRMSLIGEKYARPYHNVCALQQLDAEITRLKEESK